LLKLELLLKTDQHVKISELVSSLKEKNIFKSDFYLQQPKFLFFDSLQFYYKGDMEKAIPVLKNLGDIEGFQIKHYLSIIQKTDDLKRQGNECFQKNDYESAKKFYSSALLIDTTNKVVQGILLSNRSTCFIRESNHKEALRDICQAILFHPSYSKAYLKRANIYQTLNHFDAAIQDFQSAQKFDSTINVAQFIQQTKTSQKNHEKRTLYDVLGLKFPSSLDEIKKSYRKLAIQHHPDKNNDFTELKIIAERNFKDIGKAYDVLSDEKEKFKYDLTIDISKNNFSSYRSPFYSDSDDDDDDDEPAFHFHFPRQAPPSFNKKQYFSHKRK